MDMELTETVRINRVFELSEFLALIKSQKRLVLKYFFELTLTLNKKFQLSSLGF
jgi:hypothetical protein